MNICLHCNVETTNPRFCSRKCSAIYNNHKNPKRLKEHSCKKCRCPITCKRLYCFDCSPNRCRGDITLEQAIYKHHHKSSAFALIRNRARRKGMKIGMTFCAYCGYDKHVEIAHIKPIHQFPLTALISEINHHRNIIALCPNHHWEYDNGLITLLGVEPRTEC